MSYYFLSENFKQHGVAPHFPEEYVNFYFGVDASFDEQMLYTITKHDNVLHSVKLDIMESVDSHDYWVRKQVYSNDLIFISDYSGVKVFTMSLQLLFTLDVDPALHYIDVYCFSYDMTNKTLYVWLSSKSQYKTYGYNDKTGVDTDDIKEYTIGES